MARASNPVPANASRRRLFRLAAIAFILTALAHNIAGTWHTWGDLVIDTGRELDTPKQLLAGKTLYADVRYWYGPLAPYTNALLYRLFGVHVGTLSTAGIVSAALLAWLVYRTVRLFASRAAAAFTTIALLYMNAFGQYITVSIFNFVLPYSFAATYGMVCAVASVYFLIRHARRERNCDLLLSLLFLSLTALCKLEVLFAAGVTHLVFLTARLLARRWNTRVYLVGYAVAAIIPVCIYTGFRWRTGPAFWSDNLFIPGNLATSAFNLDQAGLLHLGQSFKDLGISAAGMIACLFVLWLTARAEYALQPRDPKISNRRWAAMIVGLVGALICGGICYALGPVHAFRMSPVLLLICFLICAVQYWTGAADRAKWIPLLLLYAFGLATIPRIFLQCGMDRYGFYLMVPGLLGFTVLWCRLIPTLLNRSQKQQNHQPTLATVLCGLAMLAGLACTHWNVTHRTIRGTFPPYETSVIQTPRGTLPCSRTYRGTLDAAVQFLLDKPPGTKVVVLPEGAAITFLAGAVNPIGMHTFLPLDFSGGYDETAVIHRLAETKPEYVLVLSRPMSEYGSKRIGVDYGLNLAAWMMQHYQVIKVFQSSTYQVNICGRQQPSP